MVKWILLIVLIALVVWIIAAYNGLVKLKNKCEESFSTMDVYLKKRYDMIPNLVETVKAYAAHESKTLEGVIAARNMAMNASSTEDRIKGENMLQGTLRSLFAVSEAYPQLKADTGFADPAGISWPIWRMKSPPPANITTQWCGSITARLRCSPAI